jgi:putative ABC transport system permease protein
VNTYLTIPSRYLAGRKLRTLLTTLAIVFGVAVVFAMNLLLPTLTGALQASEQGVTGQVDMTVTSAMGGPFRASVLDTIIQTNGVAAADPAFQRSVTLPNSTVPPFDVLGLDPTRVETLRFYQVTEGRFLSANDKLAATFSQHLAQVLGLHVGDTFKLPTPNGLVLLSVVGVVGTQSTDQVLVPLQTAQQLFSAPDQLTAIDVVIIAGADRDAVKQALQSKLGTGFNVGSVASTNAYSQSLQAALVLFNVFGILTLFMGAFLIFNTFRTVVVERRRDIGMLRAVGATRGTIMRLILIESALQGIIGTAIGLVLGYLLGLAMTSGLQSLLDNYMRTRLGAVILSPGAIILSAALGIGMTVLAGLLPAISAGRVPVLAALRIEQVEPAQRRASIGAIIGAILIVLGIVSVLIGNPNVATLGSVTILVGLVMTTSLLIKPIARALDPVIRWVFAREGQLAEGNLQRNPGRASITVSAVLIALAVIVALFAVLSSVENAYTSKLNASTGADILLLPPNLGVWNSDVGVGQDFEQKLAQIPGVGNWTGLVFAPAQVSGTTIQVMGFDPATYPKVSGLTFDQGDDTAYAKLATGRAAIINGIMASAVKAKIGDDISVQTPQGIKSYHIVAIGSDYLGAKIDSLYTSKQNLATDFAVTDDIMVMANLKPGADPTAVRAGVQNLLQGYPQLTLNWGADWRKTAADLLGQTFLVLYIALAALIIPSMLGLINTLAINVLERTREIGVLRAIGATRSQIRRMVVAESLLLGVAGAALGLLAGLALGYALTGVISAGFYKVTFSFPWGGIILAVAVALIMSLLASALPARQAARVKIVQALQYE